jgi:hypothetical protein
MPPFSDISRVYFAGESQDQEDSKEDSLQLLELVAP